MRSARTLTAEGRGAAWPIAHRHQLLAGKPASYRHVLCQRSHLRCAEVLQAHAATSSAASPVEEPSAQRLTPRQKRLLQQKRKWEEAKGANGEGSPERAAASQAPQGRRKEPADSSSTRMNERRARPSGPASFTCPSRAGSARAGSGAAPSPTAPLAPHAATGHVTSPPPPPPHTAPSLASSKGAPPAALKTSQPHAKLPNRSSPGSPSLQAARPAAAAAAAAAASHQASWPRLLSRDPLPPHLFISTSGSPSQPSGTSTASSPATPSSASSHSHDTPQPPCALSDEDFVLLARNWTQELVDHELSSHKQHSSKHKQQQQHILHQHDQQEHHHHATQGQATAAQGSEGSTSDSGTRCVENSTSSSSGSDGGVQAVAATAAAAPSPWPGPRLTGLPAAAAAKLRALTAEAAARVARGLLSRQQLADLAWSVAHYDRPYAVQHLEAAMGVPFSVVPRFLPQINLQDFMSEVELRRDTIYLDDGKRAVEESRLTGWQSDIGATFRYSGKEMQPQPGGLSHNVRKVRDALYRLTGVQYDSVLINYYADGKCGMRYHVDPLYGRWTPDTAVVSLGDTRTFIFRAIEDHDVRWSYRVRNGDVVHMYGDCQDRLQHCVRVERAAEDAGPRMSLVFKERLRDEHGKYILD